MNEDIKQENDISLLEIKEELLKNCPSLEIEEVLKSVGVKTRRPLGKLNPWAWWTEIVRGCNISCDFCPSRLFEKDKIDFMEEKTWISLLKVINEVTPYSRLELCNAGEPTLHPQLLEFLSIAREICPNLQILMFTNGTQITSGKVTYKELFDAGLNMIFLDMYSPFEKHKKLAEESGYYWYHQDDKPKDAPGIFTYQNDPNINVIMFAENPNSWSKRKLGRGYLHTFLNDLDWSVASKFGLEPVIEAPSRRCDFPNKFVTTNYDGTFAFCSFDYMRHTVNNFGNINGGIKDFFEFWLGSYMQDVRLKLYNKDRNSHEYCSKCRFTSIRCDIPYWKPELLTHYWDGNDWKFNKSVL